jgi:hypothetical protein
MACSAVNRTIQNFPRCASSLLLFPAGWCFVTACTSLGLSILLTCCINLWLQLLIFFQNWLCFKFFQNTGISFVVKQLILCGENNEAITESIDIDKEWCRI